VELVLPHVVADDDAFIEREVEQIGKTGRHGGGGQDRRLVGQRDVNRQYACCSDPFECIEVPSERHELLMGERTRFSMRVSPEYGDNPVDSGKRRGRASSIPERIPRQRCCLRYRAQL
jgi:hypothetical protein